MKIAKLNVLEIEVPLERGVYFSDEGFVESVNEHYKYLSRKNGTNETLEGSNDGCCTTRRWYDPISDMDRKNIHIFYLDFKNKRINDFIRAHEETHALENFERLDLLEREIEIKLGKRIDLNRIRGEVIADIGAIFKTGELDRRARLHPIFFGKRSYPEALRYLSE